jgi:signal transduction histidine kinase
LPPALGPGQCAGWRCTQIDPQLAPAHEVDGVRLRQIVFNLLSNAIKFTARARSRLQLEVLGPTARTASRVPGVTDTGMGIAPEQLQHLFAPSPRPVPTSSATTAAPAWA